MSCFGVDKMCYKKCIHDESNTKCHEICYEMSYFGNDKMYYKKCLHDENNTKCHVLVLTKNSLSVQKMST